MTKLIKKYEHPNETIHRRYAWGKMPLNTQRIYTDKLTGKEALVGDYVIVDPESGIILTDSNNPNLFPDLTAAGLYPGRFELDLPEVNTTAEANPNKPILLEATKTPPLRRKPGLMEDNPEWQEWRLDQINQNRLIARERDNLRKNNAMVDHLFFTLPFSAPLLGIAGAELIGASPAVAQWLASPAGQAFGRSMLYGEGLNQTSKLLGYEDWGEVPYRLFGGKDYANLNQWAKLGLNFTNPGYFFNPASKVIDPMASLTEQAMKLVPTKATTGDLAKAINTEVKNKQFSNLFPGQIGWAPRQTLTGYHASNEPIQKFNYWHPNWAVIEHDAPHGIYFTVNETKPSGGFLAKRPYAEQVTSTFDKPMVLVGEISTASKNATRNSIERQAQSMGADGIIYQGIKDNQLENQIIVKTLNPDLKVNVSEIIENDPYLVTKILDKDKIRLRLPTHTKNLPREIVLEPQGNNQYRIHIRTWNGDHVPANLDSKEKQALFESVYNELPEGAEILFPESSADYPATRGTVAALTRLSRDPRYMEGDPGSLLYRDKNGEIKTFDGTSFIKRLKPSEREKLLQQVRDLNSLIQGKDIFEVFRTPLYKEAEKLIKQINESKHPIDLPLNWSSKDWFASRPKGLEPTAEEIAEFEANIPEYLEIQKNAGENWLKMPDGSIWQGDPREWVMMLSKAYKDLMQNSKFTTPMTHLMSDFRGDRVIEVPSTGAGRLWGNGFYGYINPTGKLNTSVSTTNSTYPIVAAEPQSTFVVNAKNPVTLSYKDLTPRVLDLDMRHSTDRVGSFHNLSFEGSGPYLENDIGIAPKGKAVIGFPNDQGIAYPLLKFVTGNTGRFSKDPNSSQFRSILPFILGGSTLYGVTSNKKGGKLIPKK